MSIDIVPQIQDVIARVAKIDIPEPDMDMYTAGLASVNALELLLDLEDTFGVTIPDDRFVEARTATALAGLVNSLKAEGAA